MAITNLAVSNFKSFKHVDLALGRFNVVIGANASGKSNFVEIFRFLKTLEGENLDDAISLHGGRESILNRKLGPSKLLQIRVTSDRQTAWSGAWSYLRVWETGYDFSLQFGSPRDGASVKEDHFTQQLRTRIGDEDLEMALDIFMSEERQRLEIVPDDVVDRIEKERASSEDTSARPSESDLAYWRALISALVAWREKALLMQNGAFRTLTGLSEGPFGRIGVYDVNPHEVKRPHETAGIPRLEENGENLALVLRQILADPEKSRMFHNLLRDILPFAVEIGTEQYLGTSILLKLREKYYEDALLANLLSDGTVDAAALIIALYFEDKDVVIIEEPERNIHPHLISRLVEMMKDAARKKQIIVTTHSPEVVRHAGVENLLLVTRDKDGFSTISKPAEKEEVKIFLKNDLGLDELFIQDVLAM